MQRDKTIFNCKIVSIENNKATLHLEAESGTYIKEFVSGDSGRTKPNLSDELKTPCSIIEMDVLEVKGE
jgi:tRNA pseudouridine synthase 10